VFNDLLTEIQRSIGYFTSIDRGAKIERMVAVGNAMKMPGLRRYLAQNLGFDVTRVDAFNGLTGAEVLSAPAFKENQLCFGVCYGLALQGMGKSSLRTNLLPKELVKDRLIREKKPWAVAAAAVLLMALSISFVSFSRALGTVDASAFGPAESRAKQVDETSKRLQQEAQSAEAEFDRVDQIGKNLVGNVEGRVLWLEVLTAINNCLPKDPPDKRPDEIVKRNELHLLNLECQKVEKLEDWFAVMKQQNWYLVPPDPNAPAAPPVVVAAPGTPGAVAPVPGAPAVPGTPGTPTPADPAVAQVTPAPGVPATPATPAVPGAADPAAVPPAGEAVPGAAPAAGAEGAAPQDGPKGPGWIIQLTGYHDHNPPDERYNYGAQYVVNTLITQLFYGKVFLPTDEPGKAEWVTHQELGISYPVLLAPERVANVKIKDPNADAAEATGAAKPRRMGGLAEEEKFIVVPRFNFVVQFCWQPIPASERRKLKQQQQPQQPGEQEPMPPAAAQP